MDLYDKKEIHPMLIKELQEPFDSQDYIYELKLDGMRCIAYLDDNEVELRNMRNMSLNYKFPELMDINKQVKNRCILDGELIVMKNGVPDFTEVQRRSTLTKKFKIQTSADKYPATLVVYDILYYIDKDIKDRPLIIRKGILESCLEENSRISISRFIQNYGIELFKVTVEKELEGVVAKKKESLYWEEKRTKDWVKFKRLVDDDYIICGIVQKKPMSVLLLGQYKGDQLIYRASVSLGVRQDILRDNDLKEIPYSPFGFSMKKVKSGITWFEPTTVCTVKYMPTLKGSLRQAVFKGVREDILPKDCKIK